MHRRRFLLENLNRYPTMKELGRSPFFAECSAEIDALLSAPELIVCAGAKPRLTSFVRVAQWNIEKGKVWEDLIRTLKTDDVLQWADVILLNEADHGMIRSGNRHTARALAESLGMHMAFAPAFLELTKGREDESLLPGENRESLQGNAVLARYPVLEARIVRLPQCFESFEFHEKRYGGRNCLWTHLQLGSGRLWVGSTHLEVRNTPHCRADQMRHLMKTVPGKTGDPCVLGGDFNTNTFRRGTPLRTIAAATLIAISNPARIAGRLTHPERHEPLFRIALQCGFATTGLNPVGTTATASLTNLEDAGMLPRALLSFLQRRIARYEGRLDLKLDWFLGRSIRALRRNEAADGAAGVTSLDPGCRPLPRIGTRRISDHSPVYCDLQIPGMWGNI